MKLKPLSKVKFFWSDWILKGSYMLLSCCNALNCSCCMQARAHYPHTGLPARFRIVFKVLLFAFYSLTCLFVLLYVKLFSVFYCFFVTFLTVQHFGQPLLFLNVLYK